VKKCGYLGGHCANPGPCEFFPEDLGQLVGFGKLPEGVLECPHHRPLTTGGQYRIKFRRRRRDWKVGNPYDEGTIP